MVSQPQTTISSEADISRQQRGSQEPSSEFLRVSLFESSGDVAESNSQLSLITVHVDSSESLLTENITQSSLVQSQEGDEVEGAVAADADNKTVISSGSGLAEGEGEMNAAIVVGIVEPERASQEPQPEEPPQQPQQQQQQQGEEQPREDEDREAVSETREGKEEEEETTEVEDAVTEHVEEAGRVKDATMEQADTTQKLEEGMKLQSYMVKEVGLEGDVYR